MELYRPKLQAVMFLLVLPLPLSPFLCCWSGIDLFVIIFYVLPSPQMIPFFVSTPPAH